MNETKDRNSAIREIQARRDFANTADGGAPDGGLPTLLLITLDELSDARHTPRILVPDFLFADARARIAPGGTNKTTLALYEVIRVSLGLPI